MTQRCEQHREQLIAFVRGELEPLVSERLDAHLGHCTDCTDLHDDLVVSLSGAAAYAPELEPKRLDQMMTRLVPYMERRGSRTSWRFTWALAPAVAALLLVIAGAWMIFSLRAPAETMPVAMAVVPAEPLMIEPLVPQVIRAEPAPFARLVARTDWGGHVQRQGRRVTMQMARGFVAVSFAGGRGRKLRISTPAVTVDVVGTRFFVEIDDDGRTHIGVAEGKVRVRSDVRSGFVAAGEVRTITIDGRWIDAGGSSAAAPFLDDPYLTEHQAPDELAAVRQPRPKQESEEEVASVKIFNEPQSSNILAELERAEELASAGRMEAAVAIYRDCAADRSTDHDPYRALCGLELGRLVGFELGRLEQARSIFDRLIGSGTPEIDRQASLARCELDLNADPCRAAACLSRVAGSAGGDATLRDEAARLLRRSGLADRQCAESGE